jgi:hypothetical protein
MAIDNFKRMTDSNFHMNLANRSQEYCGLASKIKGEVFWKLRLEDGTKTSGHFSNMVTLDASILVARFFKGTASPVHNQSEPAFGVLALAVGTGYVGWDPQSPPSPKNTQRSLWNEIGRKAIVSTAFITAGGLISSVPTNVVDFTTVFSESEAVGPLTEMGLIAGDANQSMSQVNPVTPPNGTYDPTVNTIGKDTLVNYTTFKVLNKPLNSVLDWTWRLTF